MINVQRDLCQENRGHHRTNDVQRDGKNYAIDDAPTKSNGHNRMYDRDADNCSGLVCKIIQLQAITQRGAKTTARSDKLASLLTVTYSCRGSAPAPMHRLTARLLLILMLSGTFAPAALAISAESPHACCKRKPLHDHGSDSSEVRAPDSANHDCCRPLTISQRAQPRPPISGSVSQPSGTLLQEAGPSYCIIDFSDSRSARAPPILSIA